MTIAETADARSRLDGRCALVTGGASGIGAAIARRLAAAGARLFIGDLDRSGAERLAGEVEGEAVILDVTSEADWRQAATRIGPSLDLLVNAAGRASMPAPADPETGELAAWRALVEVNGDSVFLACRAMLPALKASGRGAIVTVASLAAEVATPFSAGYGFAKAGVVQLTKSIAFHCTARSYPVRCNAVLPGHTDTPLMTRLLDRLAGEHGIGAGEMRALFESQVPMRRMARPEEIADAVFYLGSDMASYVTGTTLIVDGGISTHGVG